MARVFFGLLILLDFILYSKYESRLKGRHGSCMLTLLRWLILRCEARVQVSVSGITPCLSAGI